MKKLLTAALFAALAVSFSACSDDDDTVGCFEPMAVQLLNDYNTLGTTATSLSTQDQTAEAYVTACTNFVTNIEEASTKWSALTSDELKEDWDKFKNTNWACKALHVINTALGSLNVTSTTANIKEQAQTCSEVAFGAGSEGAAQTAAALTSLEGWNGILQTAANYTAAEAAK